MIKTMLDRGPEICDDCGQLVFYILYTDMWFCPDCGENNFYDDGSCQMV